MSIAVYKRLFYNFKYTDAGGRIMEKVKEEMIAEVTERLKAASPEGVYMVLNYLKLITA